MTYFVKWLYISTVAASINDAWLNDLWYLGEKLGSPHFQNAVVKALFSACFMDEEVQHMSEAEEIEHIWKEAEFLYDGQMAYGADRWPGLPDVIYRDNKRLMFVLDCRVHWGQDSEEFEAIIHAGGALAVHLVKRFAVRAADKLAGNVLTPWDLSNIQKYLTDTTE